MVVGLHRRCTKVFVGRFRLEEDANPKGNADTMTVVLVTEALADYMRGEMQISLPGAAQDLQMLFVFKHLTSKEYECYGRWHNTTPHKWRGRVQLIISVSSVTLWFACDR